MKTVLNYSAYYEVFSIGVVDSGYTAVARMLFSPLFDPHILLDKNGVPYEVNNQNAQGWSIGKDLIPKEIQKAANDKKWKEKIISHFTDDLYPAQMNTATKDEMLNQMHELITECDLDDKKKNILFNLYKNKKYGMFLAKAFIFALLGRNKIKSVRSKKSAGDKQSDALDEFRSLVQNTLHKPKTVVPVDIQDEELGYVTELYAAYGDATGADIKTREDLNRTGYQRHFEFQRKSYYMAETIHQEIRDSILPDEEDCFDVLKDEIEFGIYETCRREYDNAVKKGDAVMERAVDIPLSPNIMKVTLNWIGAGEKKGICHMLVSDKRLKWVGDYDE